MFNKVEILLQWLGRGCVYSGVPVLVVADSCNAAVGRCHATCRRTFCHTETVAGAETATSTAAAAAADDATRRPV